MIKIKSLEIENPYRYRGYEVGKPVMYDIQNEAYIHDTEAIVKSIKHLFEKSAYLIVFDNREAILVSENQPGLIITNKKEKISEEKSKES